LNQEVAVQWAEIDVIGGESLAELLSTEEQARAQRLLFNRNRRQFIATRGLLRRLLGERLGVDPARIEFAYDEHGKPRLAAPDSGLRFNVSHSDGLAAFAFCEGREVGVDVEAMRDDLAAERIARRYLPAEAADRIDRSAGADRVREFFRAWVRQEAYAKGRGEGLRAIGESPEGWTIADLEPMDGYAGAVAVEGSVPLRLSAGPI
jgi:4'-phosphopantetheinyl transferase